MIEVLKASRADAHVTSVAAASKDDCGFTCSKTEPSEWLNLWGYRIGTVDKGTKGHWSQNIIEQIEL
jgi:hypothetical protein